MNASYGLERTLRMQEAAGAEADPMRPRSPLMGIKAAVQSLVHREGVIDSSWIPPFWSYFLFPLLLCLKLLRPITRTIELGLVRTITLFNTKSTQSLVHISSVARQLHRHIHQASLLPDQFSQLLKKDFRTFPTLRSVPMVDLPLVIHPGLFSALYTHDSGLGWSLWTLWGLHDHFSCLGPPFPGHTSFVCLLHDCNQTLPVPSQMSH